MNKTEIRVKKLKTAYKNRPRNWESGPKKCDDCEFLSVNSLIMDPVGMDCRCKHPKNKNNFAPYDINNKGNCDWFEQKEPENYLWFAFVIIFLMCIGWFFVLTNH